ncbi:MAG: peptidylprolyl isomerase [Ginsengibacter sp.]
MKKLFLLLITLTVTFISYGQTLFTYGNHKVAATEFLDAYNKNKTNVADSSQALRDYLNLYVKFKLKVQAAKDLHLDTLPSLEADLHNFRSQIEGNYLKDDKETKRLTDEAFERSQKDIHVVYFFEPVGVDSDTSITYNAIKELYQELKKKQLSDEEIIAQLNKGSVQIQKNDAGYITAFTLPYEFENIVYNLKPGHVSAPYRTKKGWFIFKNTGERHAVGKITIAQILFAIPEGHSQGKDRIKKTADSVYNALRNGADFGDLAKQFSDDRSTFYNGGKLPEFGTAKYDSIFEDHAFALKKDGEISAPFETEFGYHIIERVSAAPVPATQKDEAFMYNLKQDVANDSRIHIAQKKFVTEIVPIIGSKKLNVNQKDLWVVTDSSLMRDKNVTIDKINENTSLFTYNNNTSVKVRDWILYLRNLNSTISGNRAAYYETEFKRFSDASAVSNYASRLEEFSPAFKSQIREFTEGNMLFEVMQRKVWGKASSDTMGLKDFYNQHKEKYFWNSSAEAIIFSCSNKDVATDAMQQLRAGKTWKEILSESPSKVQADSGRYELGQIPVVDRTYFTKGLITAPVINKNDGTAVFAQIIKLYPDHQQRSFEDARGLVINDYQSYLEQKWVSQLEKKYPVKINEKVFQGLLK